MQRWKADCKIAIELGKNRRQDPECILFNRLRLHSLGWENVNVDDFGFFKEIVAVIYFYQENADDTKFLCFQKEERAIEQLIFRFG